MLEELFEVLDLLVCFVSGDAISLLNLARQLFTPASNLIEAVIG